jgi:hypothetical protein
MIGGRCFKSGVANWHTSRCMRDELVSQRYSDIVHWSQFHQMSYWLCIWKFWVLVSEEVALESVWCNNI